MTEFATKAFGRITIDAAQIVEFSDGLLGFPRNQRFALLDESDDSPFKWLQSLDDPALAFVVLQPELFHNSYQPEVLLSDLEQIGAKAISECLIFTIVTIPAQEPEKMTANLQGPILIHRQGHQARQVISLCSDHPVRYPILSGMEG